jgi:hypothetical protein
MDTFMLAVGWWNFIGSVMMLGFLNESFGQKMLNEWTKIFVVKFTLDYWSRLWLGWAAGLNIFFGLVNIIAVNGASQEMKKFLVCADLAGYIVFLILAIMGFRNKKLGSGAYSVFLIFSGWLAWGTYVLFQ